MLLLLLLLLLSFSLLLLSVMILIIGFTCPPTIHFKFITKCLFTAYFFLQTATILEYKVRFIGITKCDRTNIYKFPDGTFQTELNSWSFASKPSLILLSGVRGRFSVNGSDLYTMVM